MKWVSFAEYRSVDRELVLHHNQIHTANSSTHPSTIHLYCPGNCAKTGVFFGSCAGDGNARGKGPGY